VRFVPDMCLQKILIAECGMRNAEYKSKPFFIRVHPCPSVVPQRVFHAR
jgi:hypothetical protein